MTKEEIKAVNEVKVVLEVLSGYIDKEENISNEKLKYVVNKLKQVEEDYNKTINELLYCNSLVVKYERLMELIGTLGTFSVEDEAKLDMAITVLSDCVKDN